jgi:hypothetical protein
MPTHTHPLFRQALGDDAWNRLAPVVRRHYDMAPHESGTQILTGIMEEVFHAPIIRPWLWLGRWLQALVPYSGSEVPVKVRNRTDSARPGALFWHRTFHFPDGRRSVFASRMEAGGAGEIIEFLRLGVGVRMAVSERNGALVFTGRDHCWRIGTGLVGIPNWALLGDAVIVESAVSDAELRVDFEIVHPLFGRTFGYRGRFKLEAGSAVAEVMAEA